MAVRMMRALLFHFLAAAILLVVAATQAPAQPSKPPQPPAGQTEADRQLAAAFGADSMELRMQIRIWNAHEKIALTMAQVEFHKDNRAHVQALSIAFFLDGNNGAVARTARMPNAVLRLDRAITEVADLARCKILAIDAIEAPKPNLTVPPSAPVPPTPAPSATDAGEVPKSSVPAAGVAISAGSGALVGPAVGTNKNAQDPLVPPLPPSVPPPIDPIIGAEVRFKFKIDPKTPLSDLLPTPRKMAIALPHWSNEDLARVPELAFGVPVSSTLSKDKAMEATAHVLAKINHVNRQKTDGFMLALLDKRSDLRGLPVLMGAECRTREEHAKVFAFIADFLHKNLIEARNAKTDIGVDSVEKLFTGLAEINLIGIVPTAKTGINRATQDQLQRATVAALMQILMPESEVFRTALAKYLATVPHIEATKALAKLAIFSPEEEVRAAAIEGLKTRREKDFTDILLSGFRYPLPAVSKRAAEALVKLERRDLLANLIEVLERPDPRLPVTTQQAGKDVTVVRELVRVNHHRNCVLCHAPGNTETTPEGVLTVAVPLPTEPLPKPSNGGYQSTPPASPDIVVRIDMTYLRQDFSLMMPVDDPHPWPEMQRFDFLVRTRELAPAEAQKYEPCCADDEPGRLSPYHRAALFALRELTGRDTEPTAAAWRKLAKLPR